MLNKVCMVCRLVADPEVKSFSSGNSLTNIRVACTNRFGQKEETVFVDVEAWGKLGEIVAQHKKKGDLITVDGRLKQDSWEDKDGNKRSKLLVTAENISFISNGNGGSDKDGGKAEKSSAKKQTSKQNNDKQNQPDSEDDLPF